MSDEQQRLDNIAAWYLDQQLNFDRRMVWFRYQTLLPHLKGPDGLELGSAEGEMTHLLLPHFQRLTCVDAAGTLLERVPDAPNLRKIRALFEDFEPEERFDTVVAEHVLEHVADAVALLRRARGWLKPGGKLILGVPNARSIHRLVAVKMGLLSRATDLNERDRKVGHRRVYTVEALERDIAASGLKLVSRQGVFFKPISNQQIEEHWNESMIQGFFLLGQEFPDLAAEICAVCTLDA